MLKYALLQLQTEHQETGTFDTIHQLKPEYYLGQANVSEVVVVVVVGSKL